LPDSGALGLRICQAKSLFYLLLELRSAVHLYFEEALPSDRVS